MHYASTLMLKKSCRSSIASTYWVWFLGAFFFFVDYVLRVSPSILTPTLMQQFQTSAFTIGGFSAFFYYAYISMQIPVGILVDRFGPARLLMLSAFICAGSTYLFASMTNIPSGLISRLLMGFGASFAFVGTLKLVSLRFQANQFAFFAGLTQAMGMLGAMVGQGPMGYIYQSLGWRTSLYGLSILFIVLAFLMIIFLDDKPANSLHRSSDSLDDPNHTSPSLPQWDSLKTILTDRQIWLNCLFIGLLYAPSACFGEQWGASFLSLSQGISIEAAGQETGMMFIGLAIGCPCLGWLSDRLGRRLFVMRLSAAACFILLISILYASSIPGMPILTPKCYTILLFIYGFFNGGIVISYALASETSPPKLTGITLGIVNMASVIVGALLIPFVGFILDCLWEGQISNSLRLFELKDYQLAFAPLPLGFLIALAISVFQREPKRS